MSNEYITTIGLEIHAELHTNSKMWCGCKNDPLEKKANQNVCEICMAHPGTLPVANKEAIKKVIQVGLAVNANIADFTEFDRKNYFYPDIPKAYQITQYKYPIVSGGEINGIALTRIHLEEDTAKSTHDAQGFTLVDYNRAGVPLMELVTEPLIHNAKDAGNFARELQRILRYLGASEANMELGQMRVEANISVSKSDKLGTKVEVKNLNSFRSVEEAIDFEVARHIEILESGKGEIIQETRGWDENKQITFSQRKKENAHDYRYFPDPDLPKLYLSKLFDIEALRKELPELPHEKEVRWMSITGLSNMQTLWVLLDDIKLANYFDEIIQGQNKEFAILASNYLVVDMIGILKKENKEIIIDNFPNVLSFKTLMEMILKNELSSRGAKDILPKMLKNKNIDVKKYAEENGLIQKNDPEALKMIINEVINENPAQWIDYKTGKEAMLMFFVGQCMKKSKGSGNPGIFQQLIKEINS